MKLDALTPELFAKALRLYLEIAYAGAERPAEARIDTTGLRSSEDVLDLFVAEVAECPSGAPRRHYALRLGNSRYPLMKLVLMQFVDHDDWFWAVDTHDDVQVEEGSPDWPRWTELRAHNRGIKQRVESAWREGGVPTARVVARSLPQAGRTQQGPLILVVDDEEGMRAAASNLLRTAGYQVVEATSGEEALERFVEVEPALVLMDFEMTGMSGIEACGRLREIEAAEGRASRTPILLATAGGFNLSQTPGADGFLQKPFQRTLLLSFVAHQLPGKKGRSNRDRGPLGGSAQES